MSKIPSMFALKYINDNLVNKKLEGSAKDKYQEIIDLQDEIIEKLEEQLEYVDEKELAPLRAKLKELRDE